MTSEKSITWPLYEKLDKQVETNKDDVVKLKVGMARFWVLGSLQTLGVIYLVIKSVTGG